jgi:TPR repeat protein
LNNLGVLYQWGRGVEKNPTKAVELYRKAVEVDNQLDAIFNLGHCYFIGEGVQKDEAKGLALWGEAADAGSASARRQLRDGYKMRRLYEIDGDL